MTPILSPGVVSSGKFAEYQELFEERFPQHRHCKAGEVIFGQAERGKEVCYYLLSGYVNSMMLHESGGMVELTTRRAGSIFPLYYSYQQTSSEAVIEFHAITDCDLLVVPKPELRELMSEKPEIALTMLDAYGEFTNYMDYSLASRLFDMLATRVCNCLYLHRDERGVVSFTQEQIAQAVGASRTKVTEALGELADAGIIETRRGRVLVRDEERLFERCSYMAQVTADL